MKLDLDTAQEDKYEGVSRFFQDTGLLGASRIFRDDKEIIEVQTWDHIGSGVDVSRKPICKNLNEACSRIILHHVCKEES